MARYDIRLTLLQPFSNEVLKGHSFKKVASGAANLHKMSRCMGIKEADIPSKSILKIKL